MIIIIVTSFIVNYALGKQRVYSRVWLSMPFFRYSSIRVQCEYDYNVFSSSKSVQIPKSDPISTFLHFQMPSSLLNSILLELLILVQPSIQSMDLFPWNHRWDQSPILNTLVRILEIKRFWRLTSFHLKRK
jgi:hypothetical protein